MHHRRYTVGGNRPGRSSVPASRRMSTARTRMSVAMKRQSTQPMGHRRQSTSRRSSTFGASKMKDSRPLKDRSYQQQLIKMLIEFLGARGYDMPISPKILTRPTGRDFFNISEFLMKCIDPRFQFKGKIEDELPRCFKALKYPFAISKTALQAVGTPHTWPPLLGALAWVVELLQYDEAASGDGEADFDGDSAEKLFYRYISDAYAHFLSGDDERAEQLDEEVAATFEAKNLELAKGNEELAAEIKAIEAETEEALQAEHQVPVLQKKKQALLMDVAKFEELIGRLEKHKQDQHRRLNAKHSELESKKQELADAENTIQTLKIRLENQELSAADVQHMKKQMDSLKQRIEAVSKKREAVQESVWETEMSITKELATLDSKVQQYHDLATSLHLLPASAKYANGVDFEIRMAPRSAAAIATGSAPLLATDVHGRLRDALRKLKQHFTDRRFAGLTSCEDLHEAVADRRAAVKAQADDITRLEARLASRGESFRAEKAQLERRLAGERDELELLEAEIDRTRETQLEEATEDAALTDEVVARAQAELDKLQDQLTARRAAVQDKVARALDYLTQHKDYVQRRVAALAEHTSQTRDRLTAEIRGAGTTVTATATTSGDASGAGAQAASQIGLVGAEVGTPAVAVSQKENALAAKVAALTPGRRASKANGTRAPALAVLN